MTVSAGFVFRGLVACLLGSCFCYADSGQHPVRLDVNSNCVECHADHATGDHVHPAVNLGCTSCHLVETRDDSTYIVLKPTKSVVCFECHQPVTYQYTHLPYASGMCTRCHNPHVSANAHLLRTKVNELCLSCHLRNPQSAPSQYMPTIALTSDNRIGHPYERHPVSGVRDPLAGGELSCISCHQSHGGGKEHLLKMASQIPEDALNRNTETNDMCRKCHMRLWGLEGAGAGKKAKKKKANSGKGLM